MEKKNAPIRAWMKANRHTVTSLADATGFSVWHVSRVLGREINPSQRFKIAVELATNGGISRDAWQPDAAPE
jgi:hypothetical protein